MKIFKVYLLDTRTGKRAEIAMECPDGYNSHDLQFRWTEGDYSCDCNRSLSIYGRDEANELPCNTGENQIVLEKLEVDGEEIAI